MEDLGQNNHILINTIMKKFIRIETSEYLSEEEVEIVFDIINEYADIVLTTAMDEDGQIISDEAAVMVYDHEDVYVYEIQVSLETENEDAEAIVQALDEELDANINFEVEIVEE